MASNPYAGADAGVALGAKKPKKNAYAGADAGIALGALTRLSDPYGRPTSGAGFGRGAPTPATNNATAYLNNNPFAAADAGGMDTSNYAQANSPLAKLNQTVNATAAAPAAAAPAAPEEVKRVNPLTALYEQLFSTLGDQRTKRDEFWAGQNADLTGRYQTANDNQAAAAAQALAAVGNGVNPYQQITTPASTTTGNPLAAYMEATGVDPSQVNALVGLNSANNAQYDSAVNNSLATLGAAYDQANQSRLGDLSVMNAGFKQDIDAQRNALAAQMASQQAGDNAAFDQREFDARQAQIGDNQAWDTNNESTRQSLFQNILSSYGDSLDPQSLVDLVTAFAKATGVNPSTLMPAGGA